MKFIISSLVLAGVACATVALTNSDFSDIEAGTPFEITWADAEGPVTVTLKSGPSDNLQDVAQITCEIYPGLTNIVIIIPLTSAQPVKLARASLGLPHPAWTQAPSTPWRLAMASRSTTARSSLSGVVLVRLAARASFPP